MIARWSPIDQEEVYKTAQCPLRVFCASSLSAVLTMSFKSRVLALLAATAIVCEVQALLTSNGMTVTLNDIPYYIPAAPIATVDCDSKRLGAATSLAGLVPLTVVQTSSLAFSQSEFAATIANYTATDDVFQPGFLQGTSQFTFLIPSRLVDFELSAGSHSLPYQEYQSQG